jgi:hypothetical protein
VKEDETLRSAYKITVGKSEVKRALGMRRRKWNDNVKADVTEIVCEAVDGSHLSQYTP